MSRLKTIMEDRAKLHTDAVALLNADKQTPETRSEATRMLAEVETLSKDIANIQLADKQAAELAAANGALPTEQRGGTSTAEEYRSAYSEWLLKGKPGSRGSCKGGTAPELLSKLDQTQVAFRNMTQEQRDQQAGTQSITYTEGNLGGYFVPAGFVQDIEKATKYFCPLLDGTTIRIMETATGNVLPYPTSNDTNQAWHLTSETTQVVDKGTAANYPTTGTLPSDDAGNVLASQITFGAFKGSTGLVRVSLELMQDSAFSLEAFLKEAFGIRLARGYEYYLTQGSGTNAPFGLVPAVAASGAVAVTAAGSSANDGIVANTGVNSIGYQDIVNLIHSVDPTYRIGAKFMFNDQTLAHLKTRIDKFGRPLWVPSVRESEPDKVAGYSYVINQSIAGIAPSATVALFGAFNKFIARKVRDLSIARLDERFADFGEVAYIGFSRIDSRLVDAGTHPINALVMHS
jgi:HK97 family phage major capsid protein